MPCGTLIKICRTKTTYPTCTQAVVVDRGPYGALDKQGKWHLRTKLLPGERWRGIVDLLPPVAQKLGITGLAVVVIYKE